MKIALCTPVFWPEVRRGGERMARELADALLARGHDVVLLTSAPRPSETVEDGLRVVRVRRVDAVERRLRRRMYEEHLAHWPFLQRALRSERPDVVHALYATDAVAAIRADVAPVVFSYLGIPHRASLANRRRRKELVVEACARSAATVALGEAAAEGFRRWLGVDPLVVAPPVDTAHFTPGGERAAVPTVLCAADASQPRKRVGLLREAVARLDGVALELDGDPVDLSDRDVLRARNRRAWVHALPSTGEAFGLVLAEALACGTPVVGRQPEVVGDCGAVFTGDDPGELASALRTALDLARDPATPARCRARAERWSADACAAAYEAIYSTCSSSSTSRQTPSGARQARRQRPTSRKPTAR